MGKGKRPPSGKARAQALTPDELARERWREVACGDEMILAGYEVSDMGRVRSWRRRVKGSGWQFVEDRTRPPKYFMPALRGTKPYLYPSVGLRTEDGRSLTVNVHRLVLITFAGEGPPNTEVAHGDGNRLNPRLSNLRWATKAENSADRLAHGTMLFGVANPSAKLPDDIVVEVRAIPPKIASAKVLAGRYGVSPDLISQIRRGIVRRNESYGLSGRRSGEDMYNAKLSSAIVRQIRLERSAGATYSDLAGRFGLNRSTVWSIVHRKTWKHVA